MTFAIRIDSGLPTGRQQFHNLLRRYGVNSKQTTDLLKSLGVSGTEEPSTNETATDENPRETVADVIRRLQSEGVDPEVMRELQRSFPVLGLPGVRSYVDQTLSGLSTGKIEVEDLRNQAIKARQGLSDIKSDLGPSGAALDGYLGILDRFIRETESIVEKNADPKSDK